MSECSVTCSPVSLAVQCQLKCSVTCSAVSFAVQCHLQCSVTCNVLPMLKVSSSRGYDYLINHFTLVLQDVGLVGPLDLVNRRA